jgi:hypothetical protein
MLRPSPTTFPSTSGAAINRTNRTVEAAVYDITDPEITSALAASGRRGVNVRIVSDQRQASGRNSEITYLEHHGILSD